MKDIITERVLKEVENYNNKLPEYFKGLIQPSAAEKTLNGYKLKNRKKIDGEKQVYTAPLSWWITRTDCLAVKYVFIFN